MSIQPQAHDPLASAATLSVTLRSTVVVGDYSLLSQATQSLIDAGRARGLILYDIRYRSAGWAVGWFDKSLPDAEMFFERGLVVSPFYPSLLAAFVGEIKRLSEATRGAE